MRVETEQLLEAALQLPRVELERFLTLLAARSRPSAAPSLPPSEAALLKKINQGLPPAAQDRFRLLVAKRQAYTLAPDELQELISLSERLEQIGAQRLEHLIELAALRRVTLDELLDQLGIKPVQYD